MKKISIKELAPLLTTDRKSRIDKVLSQRTKGISILLEDIYQSHNISAVLRTCDNLGIQNIYIIQDYNKVILAKGVSLGSEKWITLKIKDKTTSKKEYIRSLKNQGFKIISTVPPTKEKSINVNSLKITKKMIIAFGNEEKGLSNDIIQESDSLVSIPMHGFNESYNISVSCAIVMNQLIIDAKKQNKLTNLTEKEKSDLRFDWYMKSIKHARKVVRNLAKNK
jgi:tRNA (guanosine-2'-O-)-methyltransferase|tara:strand:+ start:4152 stop:4820 length:669 start_codon:yes stop_codon:yes gene_type:complete